MITFSLIDPEEWRGAYKWHRDFVSTNDLVFPRTIEEYEVLASEGQIWCARDAKGDYRALAYYKLGHSEHLNRDAWEVGGLMVAASERKRGVGSALVCLTLGHVLFEDDPLAQGIPVIAHVHADNNPGPRPIFQGLLQFAHGCSVEIPGEALPGLRTNDKGFVVGDEFLLSTPGTLTALAGWCKAWSGKLKDGQQAEIVFGPGRSLEVWAKAFDDMASR